MGSQVLVGKRYYKFFVAVLLLLLCDVVLLYSSQFNGDGVVSLSHTRISFDSCVFTFDFLPN